MKNQQPQKRILQVIRNLFELKIAKENLIKTYQENPQLYKSVTQNLKEKIDLEKSDIVALDVDLKNLKIAYENKNFDKIDSIDEQILKEQERVNWELKEITLKNR